MAAAPRANLTECPNCSVKYNSTDRCPRLLPCTHTICFQCVQSCLIQVDNSVKCPTCQKEHSVTNGEEAFPVNEDKLELLRLETQQGEDQSKDHKTQEDLHEGINDRQPDEGTNAKDETTSHAKTILKVAGGVVGAGASVVAAPAVLGAIGFRPSGVAAGTLAAWWMSVSGPIAKGSLYSTLQSAGAAGIGLAGNALLAASGGAVGTGIGAGISKVTEKLQLPQKSVDDEDEGTSVDGPDIDANASRSESKESSKHKLVTVVVSASKEEDTKISESDGRNVGVSGDKTISEGVETNEADTHSNDINNTLSLPIQCEEDLLCESKLKD